MKKLGFGLGLFLLFSLFSPFVSAQDYCIYSLKAKQCVAPAPPESGKSLFGQDAVNGLLLLVAFFLSILILVSYLITSNTPDTRDYWSRINSGEGVDFSRKANSPGKKAKR